ncbi:SpoIIE family protein phosphatase [Streptomyces sp. ISL-43]|uniref:SpoIIE family protein phosphatase n=1 Tax=Streptomyces sp. ISL-43 TaxID=2819183 RepID=UPI001BEBF0BF|nr:SpoIIE family protein phosphatase [Streptomyces sp. ISL-43]MBT2449597.1 SpoIIE family protein phosphatase [Streptomyces sp. ISL-43]
MSTSDAFRAEVGQTGAGPAAPGGLLDVLSLAAVVLDDGGRIVLWSPQAEDLFGYSADEALGQFAARLLVDEQHLDLVIELFARVMESGRRWAGGFPVRHKDGSTRLVEFRNMRLQDERGDRYALGIATDQATLRRVERDLALSLRLVSQSPIGLGVMDTDLRYVLVNPALERMNGRSASDGAGLTVGERMPFLGGDANESALREVLATGVPLVDRFAVGPDPADPGQERAWSVSFYRLEDPAGRVLGLATSVVDVTEQHRAAVDAARARRRLALVADASVRIGTTLDLEQTARELAGVCVPQVADVATVDVLDSVLHGLRTATPPTGPARFRALAVVSAYPTEATRAADPVGDLAQYDTDRLVTQCVNTGRTVVRATVTGADLRRIARDDTAATLLAAAGLHSYLAVPLIARGEVIGVVGLQRARNPAPFDGDDVILAGELAARAAVCIDNARWFQSQRHAALTLQRNLLPNRPAHRPGLDIAHRYQPAGDTSEIGGDWFDVIPLPGDKTALIIGDVMGSGIDAAATMGQLRTATRTLAQLDLGPAQILHYLDQATAGMDHTLATCAYAVYNPHDGQCRISLAGHLPPVLMRLGRPPELLDLPTGAPLGVGGVPFHTTRLDLATEDQLVLYTDGLVETRDQSLDERLDLLLSLLTGPRRTLEDTCDLLLRALRHPGDHDDVALLIARLQAEQPTASP